MSEFRFIYLEFDNISRYMEFKCVKAPKIVETLIFFTSK